MLGGGARKKKQTPSKPLTDDEMSHSQDILNVFQTQIQSIGKQVSALDNGACLQHGVLTCSGSCEFMYSLWSCVPRGLSAAANGDMKVAVYIIMHSPRLREAVETVVTFIQTQADAQAKSEALQNYMKRVLSAEVWDLLQRDPSDETFRIVAQTIAKKAAHSKVERMKLSIMAVIAVGVSAAALYGVSGLVGTVVGAMVTLLRYTAVPILYTYSGPLLLLLFSCFALFSVLQFYSSYGILTVRQLREELGRWVTGFEDAIISAEFGDRLEIKPERMSATQAASSFFLSLT